MQGTFISMGKGQENVFANGVPKYIFKGSIWVQKMGGGALNISMCVEQANEDIIIKKGSGTARGRDRCNAARSLNLWQMLGI